MRMKEAVVHRFQDLCRERNIKYNELATLSGVTPSTVYSMMDPSVSVPEFFSAPCFEKLEQEIY